jgi:hypothetical protein
MTKTFRKLIYWGFRVFEFGILVIDICFGFRASNFGFAEKLITRTTSLVQGVTFLRDRVLDHGAMGRQN